MKDTGKRNIRSGQVDFVMLMIIVFLLLFGLIMLFSASSPKALEEGNVYSIILKQGSLSAIGCFLMFLTSNYDYHIYKKLSKLIVTGTLFLMYIVPVIGFASHGATRQISLGPISFQPSEVAKFALVIYYASRFSDKRTSDLTDDMKNLGISAMILALFGAACVLQSHLSAAVVLAVISVMMMVAAGLPMKYLYALGGLGVLGFIGIAFSASYRLDRFRALIDPFAYERGIGWQIIQSLYAVGSGGLFGLGLGQSRQKYRYLPEAHNDYIYAVVCEELGFIGGLLVIGLFVLFVWRGMCIALNAKDRFGTYMAFGITSIIGIQMLINIGVVLSILPSTGMQLPFFSAGGTSMIVMLSGVGILLNISRTSSVKKL
ncbi:MAG: putative lipid II flippase FtsW [Clostridia bacterium]|nr:putative lipid II flippase FtsW [Clostridia bacterium]MBQ6938129.1 putative lipid II flippase FtsW [Clostridia bacterium]MBR2885750.1 putative lipid II flippase FtsW [Clostridia bacterium]